MDSHMLELPSAEELSQLFKDFKQVLRVVKYQTPLQRAQQKVARQSCIALNQKAESEVEHVFNLLPPGHYTHNRVDFLRQISTLEMDVRLKIPITLLSDGPKVVLLKNNSFGGIVVRRFSDFPRGFQAFVDEVLRSGPFRANSPRFVHRSNQVATSFHVREREALAVWMSQESAEQQLQQFVQPFSGAQSLLRVHWKASQKGTCYFLSLGPRKKQSSPFGISTSLMNRSFSVPQIESTNSHVVRSSSNLMVQKGRVPQLLAKEMNTVMKVLRKAYGDHESIGDVVCDFTSDIQHQWVFLKCQGFTFRSRKKLITQTLGASQPINLPYLIYPLVARRRVVQRKLHWYNKLKCIAEKHNLSITALMKSVDDYVPLTSKRLTETSKHEERKQEESHPRPATRCAESELMNREVRRFERVMRGTRLSRMEAVSKVDFVERHGGAEAWRGQLTASLIAFYKHELVAQMALEDIGCEQLHMKISAFLRILRGDYNFYYREALKKVHAHLSLQRSQFHQLLVELQPTLLAVTQSQEDTMLLLQRFSTFEEFICPQKETTSPLL